MTGGQASAIHRNGLKIAPSSRRTPHRKLDGSSQLLACQEMNPLQTLHGHATHVQSLHQVPYTYKRFTEKEDEDGVE